MRELDIGLIEKVQARATKIQRSIKNLRVETRLKKREINRRVKENLLEIYKSVNILYLPLVIRLL